MSGIPSTFPGLPSSKSATKVILQSILDTRNTEPSAIPRLTSSLFDPYSNFVQNIARLVMERRTTGPTADAFATAKPSTQPPGEPRDVTINQQTVRRLYGGTGNDRLTVTANAVDQVSAGAGNDTIVITAKMRGTYPPGPVGPSINDTMNKMYVTGTMEPVSGGAGIQAVPAIRLPGIAGLDDGSVTRVSGGAGDDRISITADQLAHSISGGDGNDMIGISANFVSTVSGGAGADIINIAGHSVNGIDGNSGDDVISIISTIDKSLDGDNDLLAFSSGSGNVAHVTGGSGQDRITIRAERTVDNIDSGANNDVIDIEARDHVMGINGGSGNDTMTLKGDRVIGIMGGSGNDSIDIRAQLVNQVFGGTGNETISISAAKDVGRIEGGSGNDKIEISGRTIYGVDGGEGDDEIFIHNPERTETAASGNGPAYLPLVMDVAGGSGKDKITVNVAGLASGINGGDGDDTISITASRISVSGGKGNDTIDVTRLASPQNNSAPEGDKAVSIYFAEGDGNDTLTTNSDLVIRRYSEDGLKDLGLVGAELTRTAVGEYKLTFAGSTDSITIRRNNTNEVPGTMVPVINGNRIEFHASAA